MRKLQFKRLILAISILSISNVDASDVVQLPVIKIQAVPEIKTKEDKGIDCFFPDDFECYPFDPPPSIPQYARAASLEDSELSDCEKTVGNPIEVATGRKQQEVIYFTSKGEMPLEYALYYDTSGRADVDPNRENKMSVGWYDSYSYSIMANDKGQLMRRLPDGRDYFIDDRYKVKKIDGDWYVTLPDGGQEIYSNTGGILSKKNAHGIGWTMGFDGIFTIKVTHTNGKSINFYRKPNGRWLDKISKVTDPNGNTYDINYGRPYLESARFPDGTTHTYHYGENGSKPYLLTGISINGKRFSSYVYNKNIAIQSGRSDGTQVNKFEYGKDYTIVTNPLGAITKYIYTDSKKNKLAKMERSGVNSCPNSSATTVYDKMGMISSKTDWSGIEKQYFRDKFGRVIQETSGIKNGSYNNAITIKYTWKNSPDNIIKKEFINANTNAVIKTESYEYYEGHNRIKSIKTCTSDTCRTVGYGYSFHPNMIPQSIAVNTNGKTFVYSYDSAGNQLESKNPLGHTTTYSNYDGLGNVGKVVSPNGLITEFSYDTRGRVSTEKQISDGNQISFIKYEYGPFGVTKVERNGVNEITRYNDNGTIANISLGAGNKVINQQDYVYSNLGKLLSISYKDENNVTRYSHSNNHNQLGWTTANLGNNRQNFRYEYDGVGNIVKQIDSSNKVSTFSYDSNGNLIQENRPDGSSLIYVYDFSGNLIQVRDSQGNTISYTYDGFGQKTTENSPITGLTNYKYDVDGNLISEIKADGTTITYSYDVLSRLIKTQSGNQTQVLIYDNCTNGIGLLCSTSDGVTSVGYGYTKNGKLLVKMTNIDGTVYPYYWSYDNKGRLSEEGVGQQDFKTLYEYDLLNRISTVKFKIGNSVQNVVRNITYEPYGGIKSWTYGNGLTQQRLYDQDYRLTEIKTPNFHQYNYLYNENNLITQITNGINSTKTTSLSYDYLGQLTRAASKEYTESWVLDSNYNRVSRTNNSNVVTSSSIVANQLLATTGSEAKSFKYDRLGNLIQKMGYGGNLDFKYDNFNRLKSINSGGLLTTYDYDVSNLRSRKISANHRTDYIYAPNGNILAETYEVGKLGSIYIWLYGEPIGVIRSSQVNYVHNDHLGRPELITNSNQAIVWKGYTSSYDSTMVQTNIEPFNLGFPGQYFDAESGLWYNWNRYYDPSIGRYIQSDPIGLLGGTNPYAYVGNNPISYIDETGEVGMLGAAYGAVAGGIGGYVTGGWKGAVVGAGTGAVVGAVNPWASHYVGAAAGSVGANILGQALGNKLSNKDITDPCNYNYFAIAGAAVGGAVGGPTNHVIARYAPYMRVNMIGKPLGTSGINRTPGLILGAVVEGGIVGAGEAGGNYLQEKREENRK